MTVRLPHDSDEFPNVVDMIKEEFTKSVVISSSSETCTKCQYDGPMRHTNVKICQFPKILTVHIQKYNHKNHGVRNDTEVIISDTLTFPQDKTVDDQEYKLVAYVVLFI